MQDELTVIISELNEIKNILGMIPENVVNELTTKNIQGDIKAFEEIMRVYIKNQNDKPKFLSEHKPEVEGLIKSIRDHRNVLIQYNNYLNIPILASAVFIEHSCMRLIDETEDRIESAMLTYKEYFNNILYKGPTNLKTRIIQLRKERILIDSQINSKTFWLCQIPYGKQAQMQYLVAGQISFNHAYDYEENQQKVDELLRLGLIFDNERKINVSDSIVAITSPQRNMNYGPIHKKNVKNKQIENNQILESNSFVEKLPVYQSEIVRIKKLAESLKDNLNLNTAQIYSASACFHAGYRALLFCQQFGNL
jgi:hypothetical protein